MKNLNCNVQSEYNYAYSTYSPSASVNDGILSELDVFNAHFALADFFESSGEDARYGILNFGLLSSAVARQSVSFCGKCKWKDDESKVSTLAFGLDKNHAFNMVINEQHCCAFCWLFIVKKDILFAKRAS